MKPVLNKQGLAFLLRRDFDKFGELTFYHIFRNYKIEGRNKYESRNEVSIDQN